MKISEILDVQVLYEDENYLVQREFPDEIYYYKKVEKDSADRLSFSFYCHSWIQPINLSEVLNDIPNETKKQILKEMI